MLVFAGEAGFAYAPDGWHMWLKDKDDDDDDNKSVGV